VSRLFDAVKGTESVC